MKYIIGVDGGGTKTEAVAFDLNGNQLTKGMSGYGNPLIDEARAISHIMAAIDQCLNGLHRKDCVYLYLGLAGYGGVADTRKIEEELSRAYDVPVTIVHDGIIAHAALLNGENGILTISGTGSVSIGLRDQVEAMAGGWGHLLGDEGSGYWIAIEAFKQMIHEEDNQFPQSPLTTSILKKLGFEKIHEIKKFIYSSSKGEIASIVPCVVEQAEAGDEQAKRILKDAGSHLAELTLAVYSKLSFSTPVTVAGKGSILTHIPLVQETFIDIIKAKLPDTSFILDDVTSTWGCYYLALKKMKGKGMGGDDHDFSQYISKD